MILKLKLTLFRRGSFFLSRVLFTLTGRDWGLISPTRREFSFNSSNRVFASATTQIKLGFLFRHFKNCGTYLNRRYRCYLSSERGKYCVRHSFSVAQYGDTDLALFPRQTFFFEEGPKSVGGAPITTRAQLLGASR